ncbi:MAG: GntR family transcriptional regulator [Acidimicrobiales bacterium]|jgi:DNA-binding GntR family transcriptional regulator|nr:GntR family transcriptional regulator [Acidimicrobiales bacterium]
MATVDRRSSGDQVAAHIRRMVFDGELRPGDRVRQDEIADQLGVSRIPVREAIIALDREGWVTIEPHRGAYVNGLDPAYVHDHYELFGELFGLMARRVVERGDAAGLADLGAAAEAVATATDPEAFNRANVAYLAALNRAARAPRLTSVARVMTSIVPGNFFVEVPGAMATQRAAVAAVTASLVAGDADGAVDRFRTALARQGDAVVALLASRDVVTVPSGASPVAG